MREGALFEPKLGSVTGSLWSSQQVYSAQMHRLLCLALLTMSTTISFAAPDFLSMMKSAGTRVEAFGSLVKIEKKWSGSTCQLTLVNTGSTQARVTDVIAFQVKSSWAPSTDMYGEGFTMLSQTGGTMEKPVDIGQYTDRNHYKIPERRGYRSLYGMAVFHPKDSPYHVMGFTSCKRFVGRIDVKADEVCISIDTENLIMKPGEKVQLESVGFFSNEVRSKALADLGAAISKNQPRLKSPAPPKGWCSWYCFGPEVTAKDISANLSVIKETLPSLRYIQIDDGYQPQMGDWLETGTAFGGEIQEILKTIKQNKFEPAIWVAPFVAGEKSHLFQKHPDWFVKDENGKPLRSDKVGFGGWRLGPWYCLDGTHPEAQKFLEELFRTMREEWGCTYFKLDANYWGAIHGGKFYDPKATRVEAYRRGMQAILRGTKNAFVLGCNHPLWPSIGLIHGSRSSMDIDRNWSSFTSTGRENLLRGWQNGALWWNDPDCLVLTGSQPDNEFLFHASLLYATSGMILSGDDLTKITPERRAILTRVAAKPFEQVEFPNDRFEMGTAKSKSQTEWVLLNWTDNPVMRDLEIPADGVLYDVLQDKKVTEVRKGTLNVTLQRRSGLVLRLKHK